MQNSPSPDNVEIESPIKPDIELYSDELQDMVSRMPPWITRWGTTLIAVTFAITLILAWFIKYPDIITGTVVLTTSPLPVTIVSHVSGNIVLLKDDKVYVHKDELLGYISSPTNVTHLLQIEKTLNDENDLLTKEKYELGELQPYYSKVVTAQENLQILNHDQSYTKRIVKLKDQIAFHRSIQTVLNSKVKLIEKSLALANSKFRRDSILHINHVTSDLNFEDAQNAFISERQKYIDALTSATNNEIAIKNLEREIVDLESQSYQNSSALMLSLTSAKQEMLSQITKWKKEHLFISDTEGNISFFDFWTSGTYVEVGRKIMTIIPAKGIIYAQASLPVTRSGKVKNGQRVNIRLDNFPAEEFGMVRGVVRSVTSIPSDDHFLVTIDIKNPIKTTYNRELELNQQLQGHTDIITEDLRLLERIFYKFQAILDTGK